ncbi:DUF6290 family protein [Candidatus Poriferisocius sp.]|uniref:DUF6290 family protein n=1 Tax=Candidatus Poriferisocius sp. TaxID=3101276 RepID=UPI003B0146F3
MTMLSFRVDPAEAERIQKVAESLGIALSQMIREALRRYADAIEAEHDAEVYRAMPLAAEELCLAAGQHWEPAEDWSDWADAAG